MKALIGALAVTAALLGSARMVEAHHSRAVYDLNKIVTLNDAVVKEWRWSNPHTMLVVEARDAKGKLQAWTLEGGSPSFLSRAGWKRTDLSVGAKIKVDVHPLRDGTAGGSFAKITLENGRVLGRAGAPTDDYGKSPAPKPVPQQDPLGL